MYQKTLRGAVEFDGIGTHSGEYCSVKILPATSDCGIEFLLQCSDSSEAPIRASFSNVSSTVCSTTISNKKGDSVSTVEHLMAALVSFGVFNARIIVTNHEIPILDGSSKQIVEAIRSVGVKNLRKAQKFLRIDNEVEVSDGKRCLRVSPADSLQVDVSVALSRDQSVWSIEQNLYASITENFFADNIAHARTFGFFGDMAKLRSMNLIKGTSLENTVVIGVDGGILNEEGLRDEREFIKHKVIDLLGDLGTVGMPVIGKISGDGISHTLNNMLVKEVMSDASNYSVVYEEEISADSRCYEACANS